MTALALILKDFGKKVQGSDVAANFQTQSTLEKAGVVVYPQFAPSQVEKAQVVVYSAAHKGSANIEVKKAQELNIPVCSFPKLLGELSQRKPTVAVCGCHGKTTTTSLISYLTTKAGLAPSYFVGVSQFMELPGGAWSGGELFVAEADEYLTDPEADRSSKFLYFNPKYIVCTNLEFDHPDFFKDLSEVKQAYLSFFRKLPEDGFLLLNGDDPALLELGRQSHKRLLTYGLKDTNDYQVLPNKTGCKLLFKHQPVVELTPHLFGEHNYLNLGAAMAFLLQLGLKPEQITKGANEFRGAARRLELLFKIGQNLIIDDYAHHPTEIAASLQALRQAFPEHRIALCFQPHTFSRTKTFYPDFLKVLKLPDFLGLLPIFPSAREPFDFSISSEQLLADLKRPQTSLLLDTEASFSALVKLTQLEHRKWIYLTMGAGDVYQKAQLLTSFL